MNWKGCERKQLWPNSEVGLHENISTRMLETGPFCVRSFVFKFGAPWLISIKTHLKIKSINKQLFNFLNEGMLGLLKSLTRHI
jgi:hypothetical protein